MMQPFFNPSFFNAHALPVDGSEPHAQPGNHLRVNTHPLLGLPVAPFIVWRAQIHFEQLNRYLREDVVFTNKRGRVIVPPFDVTPDNPVTARIILAPGEICLWAQVDAIAKRNLKPKDSTSNVVFTHRGSIVPEDLKTKINSSRIFDLDRRFPFKPRPVTKLICEAYVDSAMGPASIGTRSQARYAFSAPGIVEIRIRGTGRVNGLRWFEARDRQYLQFERHAIMNLPHEGGARYVSVIDARGHSLERVERQAPKRKPLQETLGAPVPSAAPLADVPFERARVQSLTGTLDHDLDRLINDTSQTPFEQRIEEIIFDEDGNEIGKSSMSRLHRVFLSLTDPGTASLLGYKLLDDNADADKDMIVFYLVNGYFRDFPPEKPNDERSVTEDIFDAMVAQIPIDDRTMDKSELHMRLEKDLDSIKGVEIDRANFEKLEDHEEYMVIGTLAIADQGAPLDQVTRPVITDARHIAWLPEVPPTTKREVLVDVKEVRVRGLLAAGKSTPANGSGKFVPLNKQNFKDFHLPLILALNVDDETGLPISEPGTGFIADRDAKSQEIRYFISQQDQFGRWSNWTSKNVAAGPRPKPPRAEFQGFYTQPLQADAATSGGAIFVKIAVPDREALAPGSHLLDCLQLRAEELPNDYTSGMVTMYEVEESTKITYPDDIASFFLEIKFVGSILQATECRRLRLTARWIDTSGIFSDDSEPQTLKMYDPRPPAEVLVPDQLQYSARPDMTGLSWVEYRWTPQYGQSKFGIYYTDENRLRAHLENESKTSVLQALDEANNAAVRATIYRNNTALFPDYLFERLRDVNVSFNSGDKGFRHAVSGSLRILNFYKVAAEAESGAKPVLLNLPLIVYGVPNADPPARPTITVIPAVPDEGEPDYVAKIEISVAVGTTEGKIWRLRRSSVESHNSMKMPIVNTGILSDIDPKTGKQTANYRDTGSVQISDTAQLKPWVRYSWIAEVQGAPESGSSEAGMTVAGRWSVSSDPVSLILLPDSPPDPVTIDSVKRIAVADGFSDVKLSISHNEPLNGGALGSYRLRIMRRFSSVSSLKVLRELEISGDGPFVISGHDDSETVPIGTEYVLELIDPLGRVSSQSNTIIS